MDGKNTKYHYKNMHKKIPHRLRRGSGAGRTTAGSAATAAVLTYAAWLLWTTSSSSTTAPTTTTTSEGVADVHGYVHSATVQSIPIELKPKNDLQSIPNDFSKKLIYSSEHQSIPYTITTPTFKSIPADSSEDLIYS